MLNLTFTLTFRRFKKPPEYACQLAIIMIRLVITITVMVFIIGKCAQNCTYMSYSQECIMRVSTLGRQEWDTPTHLIKNYKSTRDRQVSKDRLVMTDDSCTSVSYLAVRGSWR